MYRSQETRILKVARLCAIAGAVVVAGLIGANAMLGPGGPGPNLVKDQPKGRFIRPAQTVTIDRPRDEAPPQQPAVEIEPSTTQSTAAMPAPPARSAPTPAFTALVGLPTPEEAARATRIAQEKIAAEKAKRRFARERARARAIARATAAHRLDQPYYSQPTPPDYAYAPRRTYGPFSQSQNGWEFGRNGWGNGNGRTGN